VITAIRFVFLATLGSWIGIMAFLSFVVAPTVFGVLEAPQAGDVVGAIFPRYYAVGVSLGVAAVAAALFLRTRSERRRAWTLAVLALVVAVAAASWSGAAVHPQARRLRSALRGPAATDEVRADFARLHRTAVALNLVAMLAAATSLGAAATALRQ
jgi:asparagine N-glycosylation enzyme membrane subunit Stt3